jgi:hypothetical protein
LTHPDLCFDNSPGAALANHFCLKEWQAMLFRKLHVICIIVVIIVLYYHNRYEDVLLVSEGCSKFLGREKGGVIKRQRIVISI